MALSKNITLDNGITVKYHRVSSITQIINHATIIETASYTSEDKRLDEKQATETGSEMNVYINTERISIPYDSNLNITSAYEYLLTTPKYKKATRVLEDSDNER